jgi:hypothetical protein
VHRDRQEFISDSESSSAKSMAPVKGPVWGGHHRDFNCPNYGKDSEAAILSAALPNTIQEFLGTVGKKLWRAMSV